MFGPHGCGGALPQAQEVVMPRRLQLRRLGRPSGGNSVLLLLLLLLLLLPTLLLASCLHLSPPFSAPPFPLWEPLHPPLEAVARAAAAEVD